MFKRFALVFVFAFVASCFLGIMPADAETKPIVDPKALYGSRSFCEAVENSLLKLGSKYFVPLANPGGAGIARGTLPVPADFKGKAAKEEWKSSGNGSDLNRSYSVRPDLRWDKSAAVAVESEGRPFPEPEAAAVKGLSAGHAFETAACYPSRGNYTYRFSGQKGDEPDRDITADTEEAAASVKTEEDGIITGKILNQVDNAKKVKLYDKPAGKAVGSIAVGSTVKLMSLAFDGWYKVLTDDYKVAYIDGRYVYFDSRYSNPMLESGMLKNRNISTDYIVIVNQNTQNMLVYKKDTADSYKQVINSPVSTGADSTPTPNGWFTTKKLRGALGYASKYQFYMPYYVQLKGGYLIHGLPLDKSKKVPPELMDKLGEKDSHGCVRLRTDLAKYIYTNIKENNLVIIDNDPPTIDEVLELIKENS